ncbi:S8 family serine peptidase [Actinoplanes sp. NPDC051343]|uniref:S8 family serine peptidase n=1 Tax=Actinoplanes sp. NPDC051343 TaxID=3363906 RepID=UPI0037A99A0C
MIVSARPARVVLAVTLAAGVVALWGRPAFADSIRDKQWYLASLGVARAHHITEGAGVTVALIDSGVNADHRDLRGAILLGTDVGSAAAGDGRKDTDGHGTEMAGIIVGRGHGSADGVLGIAPQAKILPISAPIGRFSGGGFMTQAVDFAIAHHAGVINMSFGSMDDDALHAAIRKAQAADIVLVASSGNDERPGYDFPGRYPEVVAVGAFGRDGKIAPFSVTGSQVDLAAPGMDIVTTSNRSADDYYQGQGTSEATAVVSGAAALLRAKFPDLSAAEIVHRLTATATDAGAKGRDDSYGYGRLNIVKALTADVAPLPSAAAGRSAAVTSAPAVVADEGDLPAAKSPLLLVGIVVGLLVVVGLVAAVVVRGRQRRTRGS